MWIVQIVEYESKQVVKIFKPQATEHAADRLDRGVNINLDHERFFTEVVQVKDNSK